MDDKIKVVGKVSTQTVEREKARLMGLLDGAPEEVRQQADKVVDRLAFLTETLKALEADMKKNGCSETYMNGQNQYGQKESVAAGLYTKLIRQYPTVVKLLLEIVGDSISQREKDDFSAF